MIINDPSATLPKPAYRHFICFRQMCQYLEDSPNSMHRSFPRDQCMMLQTNSQGGDAIRGVQGRQWILPHTMYKTLPIVFNILYNN